MLSFPDQPGLSGTAWAAVWGIGIAAVILMAAVLYRRWRRGGAARHGRRAERKVRRVLRRLESGDCEVLNDLMIRSRGEHTVQIDHVVVCTRGVFVIETKGLTGHIRGREEAQYWDQRFMMSSRSFYNPLLQNDGHIRALAPHLRGVPRDAIVSAVVFTDAWRVDVSTGDPHRTLDPRLARHRWWCPWRDVRPDLRRTVTRPEMLGRVIHRYPEVLGRKAVADIASCLRGLDIRGAGERRAHNRYVRTVSRERLAAIQRGVCPRCGSALVLREGDYGPFYGCSAYPGCRFICSAAPQSRR